MVGKMVEGNLNEKTSVLTGYESNSQLEELAESLHQQALNDPNKSVMCAKKCATLIGKDSSRKDAKFCAFLQVILWKCYAVFYSYKNKQDGFNKTTTTTTTTTTKTTATKISSAEQNDRLLANSTFISELYNEGVLPDSCFWYLIMELMEENGNAQVHCLANMINLAGTKLSKTYSLTRIVGHLLLLDNETYREEVMSPDLHNLIHRLKIMHAKYWIHTVPDKTVKENFRAFDENLIKPNKTAAVRKQYELSLMADCALEDCRELHIRLARRKDSDEVKRLLSPALHASMNTDLLCFVVNVIVTAVDGENQHVIKNAAKFLADLVKAGLQSRFIVYMGLDRVGKEDAKYKKSVVRMEEEYARFLKTKT